MRERERERAPNKNKNVASGEQEKLITYLRPEVTNTRTAKEKMNKTAAKGRSPAHLNTSTRHFLTILSLFMLVGDFSRERTC